VTRLVAKSALECVKCGAGGLCLASSDIVSLDAVTSVHGFGLSGIMANLAIRLLASVLVGVGVSGGVHLKIRLLIVL
jgi:hypothetical protein